MWDNPNVPKQPVFKVVFGGVLACLLGANKLWGWFRAFDWLKKNAPAIWFLLMDPAAQMALIVMALGLSAWGLWEIWQFKHKVDPVQPKDGSRGGASTVTHGPSSHGAAVGRDVRDSSYHVGDIHYHYSGGPRSSADAHPDKLTGPGAIDAKTLESLQAIFPGSVIAELRVQQFRSTFEWRFDAVFLDFYQWGLTPEHRFLQDELEGIHKRLRDLAYNLRYLIQRDSKLLSPQNAFVRGFIPIGQITDMAAHNATCEAVWTTKDKVCDAYEELVRTAKQRFLGISAETTIPRPWIRALKYTRLNGAEGFMLAHAGETAYSVEVESMTVGKWIATFDSLPIVKSEAFVKLDRISCVTREGTNSFSEYLRSLDSAWRESNNTLGYIPEKKQVRIYYRDFTNEKRFCCECAIERDVNVRGDLAFRIIDCKDVLC